MVFPRIFEMLIVFFFQRFFLCVCDNMDMYVRVQRSEYYFCDGFFYKVNITHRGDRVNIALIWVRHYYYYYMVKDILCGLYVRIWYVGYIYSILSWDISCMYYPHVHI